MVVVLGGGDGLGLGWSGWLEGVRRLGLPWMAAGGMGEGWLVASGWALGDSDSVWRVLMGWVR
jgi:hypothetical protein